MMWNYVHLAEQECERRNQSIMALNSDYEANHSPSLPSYIMSCLKGKDIWNKILAIIIVLIPILVIFSTYRWIVVDTAREVDSMMSDIYE